MDQREKISNKFSDAYLLAMLEGKDGQEVISQFSKEFPELASRFESNVLSLNLLYKDIFPQPKPSDAEIAAAYRRVSERIEPQSVKASIPIAQPGFFEKLKAVFSSPMWAGASLGIGAAVVIALLWQPWAIKESHETAHNGKVEMPEQNAPEHQKEFALNEEHPAVNGMPEVQYRGTKTKQLLSIAQRRQQDSLDEAKLKQLAPKPIEAPHGIAVEAIAPGQIMIRWNAVSDALSYIVEMKKEGEASFHPQTQLNQTGVRISMLESGKTYFIRVIATSGERMGPVSDTKSIVVK
jgi:hypothetical protein